MKTNIYLKLIVCISVLLILLMFSIANYSSFFKKFIDYSLRKPDMYIALNHLDKGMLESLLDKGVNPDLEMKYNLRTTYPLIYVHYGWYFTLEKGETLNSHDLEKKKNDVLNLTHILLEHGADVNVNDGVVTPLLASVQEGNFKTASFLLSKGAELRDNEFTLLWLAISDGYFQFAQELLQAGADINAVNAKGNTILHELVLYDSSDQSIEQVLTDFNIDTDLRNKEGLSAYDIAVQKKRTEILSLLKERNVKIKGE